MKITLRAYRPSDTDGMISVWNEVVEEGAAFPQEEFLTRDSGAEFFASQSRCAVAEDADSGEIVGVYILHPNNIGRCAHICNASYAVASKVRGLHIGEMLVKDSLEQGKRLGYGILQFNAVVATNTHARNLYKRLGFVQLGTIPNGFRMKDGSFEDICPYYRTL